jgi:hypothetical protein
LRPQSQTLASAGASNIVASAQIGSLGWSVSAGLLLSLSASPFGFALQAAAG